MESFQAPIAGPGRGAHTVPMEEAEGCVCWERLSIQMQLELAASDQIREAPREALAQGFLCKTRGGAGVTSRFSARPGEGAGAEPPDTHAERRPRHCPVFHGEEGETGPERGTDCPRSHRGQKPSEPSSPGLWRCPSCGVHVSPLPATLALRSPI